MKHISLFEDYHSGDLSHQPKEEHYIIFIPLIKKDGKDYVDLKNEDFGAYTEEEYERLKPWEYVDNYTTSYTLPSLKVAKEYIELVKSVNGDFESSDFKVVFDFDKKNKI